jgi:drug/metabolite transporter (DMT)-like permease
MIDFLLSVSLTACLFLIFKAFEKQRVHLLGGIVVNYWVCTLSGILLLPDVSMPASTEVLLPWLPFALFLGFCFISTFYMMAYSTQKVGVSAASVASKLSLVIPVIFSLLFLSIEQRKQWDAFNIAGMFLVFVAIVLSSLRPRYTPQSVEWRGLALLFAVFFMSGTIDTTLNYVNAHKLNAQTQPLFTIGVFATAGILGFLLVQYKQWIQKERVIGMRELIGGIVLGLPNIFSLYFMLRSLDFFKQDGAFMFPIFNILVILLSTTGSVLFFRERLSIANQSGIFISLLALFLLAYQELLSVFA